MELKINDVRTRHGHEYKEVLSGKRVVGWITMFAGSKPSAPYWRTNGCLTWMRADSVDDALKAMGEKLK